MKFRKTLQVDQQECESQKNYQKTLLNPNNRFKNIKEKIMNQVNKIKTVIDLGETKIRTIVSEEKENSLRILAHYEVDSSGMLKNMITDQVILENKLIECLRQTESQIGFPIYEATIIIPSILVKQLSGIGEKSIQGRARGINQRDIQKTEGNILYEGGSDDAFVDLETNTLFYELDEKCYVNPPLGIRGRKLNIYTSKLSISKETNSQLKNIAAKVGVTKLSFIPAQSAIPMGVLTEGERELGAISLHIGTRLSTLSFVQYGQLLDTATIPGGGFNLSNDLSIGLSLDKLIAEELKLSYGTTTLDIGSADLEFEDSNGVLTKVDRVQMINLLKERLTEILTTAKSYIEAKGYDVMPPGGLVISGGSSKLDGLANLAQQIFQCPVRIGIPRGVERIIAEINTPSWSTAVGALNCNSIPSEEEPKNLILELFNYLRIQQKRQPAKQVNHSTELQELKHQNGEVVLSK
jgi:cell division protein FtsA